LKLTLQYMNEREAFGRTINRFQVLRHRIAQLAAEVEANKAFVYQLFYRYEQGEYLVKEASMAKLLGTQLADKVATQCLQMYGGYGFMEDYPMARFFRDARLGQIGGGTSEILCEIIAKMLIDDKAYRTEA
ncbi:MAG: acyl-CoA dehydrogenase family protein, partial [Bacteroidota bacterium]